MGVMIGVDPHKRSHTAVVVDGDEVELGRLEVRASRVQVDELLSWAARFGDHVWAIESVDVLGYLLVQQLVAVGERVLDVPATLAARVRVLASGRSNKNDANDGYSVAVAGDACAETACCGACRSCGGAATARETEQAARQCAHRGSMSAARAVGRADPGRHPQRNQAESCCAAASQRDAH